MTDTPAATPRFWERRIVRQFAKFCIVGGSSFVIDYCIRMTLLFAVPWHGGSLAEVFGAWLRATMPQVFSFTDENWKAALPVFATISASVAILNSFFWNRRWTFRIRGPEEAARQLRRFVVISVVGLALNVVLTTAFTHALPGNPKNSTRIATVLAAVAVAFWNFAGQRLYAFKSGKKVNAWREWRDAEPAEFAVIGDPIKHSRSPRMQEAALRAMGLDHRYVALRVPLGEVAQAFENLSGLGYRGVNVTVPHKFEAFQAMRSVEPFARRVEAVNTVRLPELAGTNTDGPGFMDTLAPFKLPRGSRVLVLGAGGSAISIVAALADGGFEVRIFNRTRARAVALNARLQIQAEILDFADPSGCDLLVNATSAGLQDAELPVDWASAKPNAVAYDLVYGSEPTRFLRSALDRGLRTIDGLPLLVAQGARSLEWWLSREAPRQIMLESIR